MKLELDAGLSLPGEGALRIAADVQAPAASKLGDAPVLLFCLAGGAMNRRYFDLQADGDTSFSFARQMAARGYVVVSVDHIGVGESSRPADGYALTPDLVAQANANAYRQIVDGLRGGSLLPGLPALTLRSVGVGHSMGAMMTVLQQAAFEQHAAVALLGFSTRGMPDFVPPEVKALAQDTAAIRARLVEFARKTFVVPYPEIKPSPQSNAMFEGNTADPKGVQAIKAARDVMLPIPAFMSMLPGNVAPEAAQIETPVFLGLGEKDIAGRPHQVPAAFSRSQDVTLYIQPGAGHSHFLFSSRTALYDRLATWLETVVR
jgi:pimeloyl-ACP methyl ester carboxylesterase